LDQRNAAPAPRRRRLGAGGFFMPATRDASSLAVSTRLTAPGGARAAGAVYPTAIEEGP